MPCGHIFFFPKKNTLVMFSPILTCAKFCLKVDSSILPLLLENSADGEKMTEELIGRSYCSELADLVWLVYGFICSRQTRNQLFIVDVGREIYI